MYGFPQRIVIATVGRIGFLLPLPLGKNLQT